MTHCREALMLFPIVRLLLACLLLAAAATAAEEGDQNNEPSDWDLASQVELGAAFTEGNTREENIRLRSRIDASRNAWRHRLSFDGFRSSTRSELSAERFYTVVTATYDFDDDHFLQNRFSHEKDRFSGFDNRSDFSVSYGQILLQEHENFTFDYTIGAGVRQSRSSADDFNEAILRLATEFTWQLSANARFIQELSVDAGDRITVTRSESAIESDILDNLSMKFSVSTRHQNNVPIDRKRLDTEATATLLVRI